MDQALSAAAESWLELNDPTHSRRLQEFQESAGPLHATAAGTPVVSAAVLVGPERAKTLAASKLLKEQADTPEGLEQFKRNFMDGATSILDIARQAAGYDPLKVDDPNRKAKYDLYLSKVVNAPFFTLVSANVKRISNKSKNWDDLINAVTDTFEGIASEDKVHIVKALGSLAKAAASSESSRQSEDLFIQNVLQASPGVYDVFIYSSHVEMQLDKEKGSTSRQSLFELATAKLRFRSSEWPALAAKVWAKRFKTVDDWLEENTTPSGGLQSDLCLASLQSPS